MQTDQRLKSILVVGGGTAGWMAAMYLNRYLRRAGCTITLVESADIGTIGVGEATVPSIVQYLRLLGIDEQTFMRRCAATHKFGIRFQNWKSGDDEYWHPFGLAGLPVRGLDLFHYWTKRRLEGREPLSYADYAIATRLCRDCKAPPASVLEQGTYAYHVDAGAFAQYLKELATSEGVRHLFGTVKDVTLNHEGLIDTIDIDGGRRLTADLFIDATGFSGRLIEQELHDPWIDWSDYLLCDRAMALPLPREATIHPYTRSTAVDGGWIWRIPLSSRTGSGIVYSGAHLSDDAAAAALIAASGLAKVNSLEPRKLKIRVGRRTRFWHRNCVAVGLSSGFVEPLESTGIHFIQRAIMLLMDYLPDRTFRPALRRAFNAQMGELLDEVRDFIILHYLLSRRPEPFWRDARDVRVPESLETMLSVYDECGRIEQTGRFQLFKEANWFFILAGNDRLPRRPASYIDVLNSTLVGDMLRSGHQNLEHVLRATPPYDTYLAGIQQRAIQ